MPEALKFHFDVDGEDFTSAGKASVQVKKNLRQLGLPPEIIRRVSIAMYEGEINMVIHAGGGEADVTVSEDCIEIFLHDKGPGIKDIERAMQEGYSTASDQIRSLGFGDGPAQYEALYRQYGDKLHGGRGYGHYNEGYALKKYFRQVLK